MPLILPKIISCDESGFTGNNLLNEEQPFFSFASVDLSVNEADDIISYIRKTYRINGAELKSSQLLRSEKGKKAICEILEAIHGRYIITTDEKKLTLACKFFEYIYEPVLQSNNALFYKHNLHRFVAMFIYMQMVTSESDAEILALEFERFMRTFDPTQAPSLFSSSLGAESDELLQPMIRFANGYRDIIAEETADLKFTGDTGKWILDLSLHNIFTHLAAWGERHPLLEVICDDSKPLTALSAGLNVMINRPENAEISLFGKRKRLTWNMSKPFEFSSSDTHSPIQLADIVAGASNAVARNRPDESLSDIARSIFAHLHEDCILPAYEFLDLSTDEAPVNWVVLLELANRADLGQDPLIGMYEYYEMVKASLPSFRQNILFDLLQQNLRDS